MQSWTGDYISTIVGYRKELSAITHSKCRIIRMWELIPESLPQLWKDKCLRLMKRNVNYNDLTLSSQKVLHICVLKFQSEVITTKHQNCSTLVLILKNFLNVPHFISKSKLNCMEYMMPFILYINFIN